MKTKLLFLAIFLMATGGSLFAQSTPVRNLFGSGAPNANLASVVGTTYVDQSTVPATVYTCTAVTLTSVASQCTWTPAGGFSSTTNPACASSMTITYQNTPILDVFLTLNCNVTTITMSSFPQGAEVTWTITQGSGGNTITFPATFLNQPAIASGAGATTVTTWQYCGSIGSGTSCPANDWQNTDVGPAGVSGASGVAFTASPNCNGTLNCFPINGDTQQIWDATIVSGANTISCPNNDCNFTSANNGMSCVATNAPLVGFTGQITSTTILPEGTLTVTGAQTATCSGGNATANATATGVLFWGHPDTTLGGGSGTDLIAAAWSATVAACGSLHFGGTNKQGTGPLILWLEQPEFNTGTGITIPTGNATCGAGSEGNRRGVSMSGTDINSTLFFIAPGMNFSNCPTNGCWLTVADGGNFHDFTMWGGGVSGAGTGKTFVCVDCVAGGTSGNNTLNNVRLMGLGAGSGGGTVGLSVQGGNSHLDHVEVDGWGGLACSFGALVSHFSHLYCGDTANDNLHIISGTAVIEDSTFGPTTAASSNIVEVITPGTLYSFGNQISDFGAGSSSSGAVYVHGGIYNAFGDVLTSGKSQALFQDGSGVTRLSGVKGSATGVGAFGINNSSGTVFDLGGNTFTGTSGAYTGPGAYIGEANSANQTIITAAKLVLSAGWGSTAAWTSLSGGNAPIQGTITNSGTGQGASPTITYTFPTPYQVAPFSCTATQTGGTNATGTFTTSSLSATGVTFTFSLTPTASSTEIVQITCVTP